MPFLVIPNEAFGDTAAIWVAAINENFDPASAVLEYGSQQLAIPSDKWRSYVADKKNSIQYQRVPLSNLSERTRYNLALKINGQLKADAVVTTIPYRLPRPGERPFTVLLGSCFFGPEDKAGAVGQTYLQLPTDATPDIKFLCGDQVYLDNPPEDFLNPFNDSDWLKARSFRAYADTWSQVTIGGGFGQLLKNNANFFCSDDHEFWNNAPDLGLNVPVFATREKDRMAWLEIGRDLYKVFQTEPGSPVTFSVEPLSFCIAETRFNRGPSGSSFMPQWALDKVGEWTRALKGPGVLVLGQPFFEVAGGWFGQRKDRGLPDYDDQYKQLTKHLRNSEHSIAILTGDVHFGRIAVARLRPELDTKLYEVISSPMQLVPHGGGKYKPAPQVFGTISSEPEFAREQNHFLTLEFSAPSTQRASMRVRFWPIIRNGAPMQSTTIGGPIELI
jgi:hypothetical protein